LKGIKWEDSKLSEEELVTLAVMNNFETSKHVEDLELSVKILKIRGFNYGCIIHAKGTVLGTKVVEEHRVNVKIKKGVCPDCSKYASGYFESVIQIRADKRFPSSEELQTIDRIIRAKTSALSVKNRMAYVSDVLVLKEGVDYYLGSYKAARKLSSAVKGVLGGVVQESPRLVGRDKSKGKDLYRIWISIRLPNFQKGDFIEYEDHKGQVKGFDGRKIIMKDLESQGIWSVMWKEYIKIKVIARSSDVKTTSVTSKTPKTIQILHPDTYQPMDIDINDETSDLKIGNEVNVLEVEGDLYILRTDPEIDTKLK
jgi:nonsense-mediated mRNA decay protein 3